MYCFLLLPRQSRTTMVFTETIDLTPSPSQISPNQEKQRRNRISITLFSELPKPNQSSHNDSITNFSRSLPLWSLPHHVNKVFLLQDLRYLLQRRLPFPELLGPNHTEVAFRQQLPIYIPCHPSNLHVPVTRKYVGSLNLPPRKLDRARCFHKLQPIPRSLNTLKP